mmetsp:Transcript_24523/g.70692  ORF Transcript_24523/g.70692 Transcript_24523/m.70692 type:complete len:210 (+) Transcript_24523:1089-1718(+)
MATAIPKSVANAKVNTMHVYTRQRVCFKHIFSSQRFVFATTKIIKHVALSIPNSDSSFSGDCDSDSQCKLGLKCFFRGDSRAVPGCMGEGIRGKDYCYDPTFVATSQRDPSPTNPPPTNPPPTNPPPTNPPPTSPNLQFATLKRVSNRNCGKRQCKKCEGDCDGDKDCQKGTWNYSIRFKSLFTHPPCKDVSPNSHGYAIIITSHPMQV